MDYIKAGIRVAYDRTIDYLYSQVDTSGSTATSPIRKRIFTPLSMVTQMKTFLYAPTYIIDNIYLGSAFNASNKEILDYYNIKYIINVTNEINNHFPDEIKYFNYKILDNNKERIIDFLQISYDKIKEFSKNNNGAILIHCFMGASRSATVVAHYLIKHHNFTPDEAIIFLKEKRLTVNLTNRLYSDLCEKYDKDKLLLK